MGSTKPLSHDVHASIWFLEDNELYATVKPYSLAFTPAVDIPRENIKRKEVSVNILDMRGLEGSFDLNQNGFMTVEFQNEPPAIDWDDEESVENVYYPKAEAEIERAIAGIRCIALSHNIRRRDPLFPTSTGKDYAHGQPLRAAHVDMTRSSAEQLIQERLGRPDLNIFNHKYLVANMWHPLKGPNQDWPLALCDVSTLNPEEDLEIADYVSPTTSREHCMQYARECHQWWYLSNQKTTEAFLFCQHHSEKGETSGTPHASFLNPYSEQDEPRESIEVVMLLYFP